MTETMNFARQFNERRGFDIYVDHWEETVEASPEFITDADSSVLTASVDIQCVNGAARYMIVGWDANRRLLRLKLQQVQRFEPPPDGLFNAPPMMVAVGSAAAALRRLAARADNDQRSKE